MKKPVADLVIGNIQGVRNFCFSDANTQTSAAVVTRGAAKVTSQVKPIQVLSVADLTNSEDVVTDQATDLTLATRTLWLY